MALDFPNSPGIGSVFTDSTSGFSWKWDGTVWQSFSSATASNIQVLDNISGSFNGSTTSFGLTVSSTAITPVNSQQLIISLGGVIQSPGVDYTISGSNIIFTTAPASGLTFFGELLGTALSLNTVANNTVSPASLTTGGPVWDTSGNLQVTGIITTSSAVIGSGVTINASGINASAGIVTATSFVGSGANLTGISASGKFNTGINSITAYAVTNSMATAYTAPAAAGRYIVQSIHVTNIDGTNNGTVSGQLYAGAISIGQVVPVPAGSSVELLKQPKVLSPGETIQLQANANSTLHATIAIEPKVGDTTYVGVGTDITAAATYTDLWTATGNSVLQSILVSNDDGTSDVKTRVVWTDGSNNIQGYYAYDMVIPAAATVEILETQKYLPSGFKVRVYANQANRLEAMLAAKTA